MNKVIDSMLAHRSIRSYTDRTVSDEDLNSIIRAVQAAPNWVNLQLVSIIAVKNTDHRRRLAELCGNQVHIAEAPVFLVFCTDYHRVALACHKKEQTGNGNMWHVHNRMGNTIISVGSCGIPACWSGKHYYQE